MKVFVTGVAGQLGHDVVNELTKRGHQAVGSDIAPTLESCASYVPLDITDAAAVEQTIMQVQPDAIVHCAAWTAVDAAEDEENQAKVRAINVDGTKHIADAAKKADAKMVYISTEVPIILVCKKTSGFSIERSTWDSAAKLTITSGFSSSKRVYTPGRSQISSFTKRKFG